MISRMDGWTKTRAYLEGVLRDVVSDDLKRFSGLDEESRAALRRDLERLKRLVVHQRTPRFAVVGKTDVPLQLVLRRFSASDEHWEVRERLGHGRWYDHATPYGPLRVADLRSDPSQSWLKALDFEEPDVLLGVARSNDTDVDTIADELVEAMERVEDRWGVYPATLVAVFRPESEGRTAWDFKTCQAIKDAFAERGFSRDFVDVVPAVQGDRLYRRIIDEAPDEVSVALARMTNDPTSKRGLADDLVRVGSSIAAAVATIPIPVADVVPITTVQMTMISGIAYVSGRTVDARNLAEFLATMGLNVGAGLAMRSLARALVKLIPVAGPVVSAAVAAGATRTLGRAAVRHYIG